MRRAQEKERFHLGGSFCIRRAIARTELGRRESTRASVTSCCVMSIASAPADIFINSSLSRSSALNRATYSRLIRDSTSSVNRRVTTRVFFGMLRVELLCQTRETRPMLCALCERRNFLAKDMTGASIEEVAPDTIEVQRLIGSEILWDRSCKRYSVRCLSSTLFVKRPTVYLTLWRFELRDEPRCRMSPASWRLARR